MYFFLPTFTKFYNTLISYEQYEKDLKNNITDHFTLIDPFSVIIDIGILHGAKKFPHIPSSTMHYTINALKFRFTPILYNHFVNIADAFSPNEDDEAWRELVRNKADIISSQRMIGIVKRRGETLKTYWYRYYCCLSGGYLYFYETNKQAAPSSYFYLKNTEVLEGSQEIGIENSLILRSKSEQCTLAFNNLKDYNAWKNELDTVIKEISTLSDAIYKKPQVPVNKEDVINETKITVNKLSLEIMDDEKGTELVKGEILEGVAVATKRPLDFTLSTKIKSIELFHPSNAHFKRILYNEEFNDNLLGLTISILDKNSPKFKGELLIVDIHLGHVIAYYPTRLVKRMMQILLDIEPKKKPKPTEEINKGEVLKPLLPIDEKEEQLEKQDTCKGNADTLLKISAKLENAKAYCLHPKYDTLFCLFSIETSYFEYSSKVDHNNFHISLGNSQLYDLTNYPNTVLPLDFFEETTSSQKLASLESTYESDTGAFIMDLVSYKPTCPDRPLTPENLSSKIEMKIGTVKVEFYNEYIAFRLMDYFFYQFLDSLSPIDSVAESLARYEKNKKPHEGKDLYEIVFFGTFASFDLKINQPLIYLRPRLHYKDYFTIDLGNVHMWNERRKVTGRFLKHADEATLCDFYNFDTTGMTITYNNEETKILEPAHFLASIELLCMEAYDYNNHDPAVLDQSIHIKAEAPAILKLAMKPEHYTYLLKCLDLNINYTDHNSDFFNFRQVKTNVIEGGIKYTLDCTIPVVSFLTLNSDKSVLSEFVAKDIEICWVNNNDFSKDITVGASHFYSLHEPSLNGKTKNIIIAPLISHNEVSAGDDFYTFAHEKKPMLNTKTSVYGGEFQKQVTISLQIAKNYDKIWSVHIVRHKMFIKLHFIMLLSHFFIEGFPSYKNSLEQPNECISFIYN